MLHTGQLRRMYFTARRSVNCLAYTVWLTHSALAQQGSSTPTPTAQARSSLVDKAIKDLANDNYNPAEARVLADGNVQTAIPALEAEFGAGRRFLHQGFCGYGFNETPCQEPRVRELHAR